MSKQRQSGYLLVGKMRARTTSELNRAAFALLCWHPQRFRTITADNGTEFHAYCSLEAATGVPFDFAAPPHSWERGTNENTNGLLRKYLPKGTGLVSPTQKKTCLPNTENVLRYCTTKRMPRDGR